MIRWILVGFDGSEPSRHAFTHGLEVASRFGARMTALAVIRVPEPSIGPEVEGVIDTSTRQYQKAFEDLASQARETGVEVELEVVVGHPAEQIVHYAEQHDVDLIVLGSGGSSRIKHLMLGSVSERVMRYAPCPVTVVR